MKQKLEMVVMLPDIRSSYNIGSIFRTSDAAGVSRVILTGYSPCPVDKFNRPQKDIAKTALGAEKTIPWSYELNQKVALRKIKKEGFVLVAVEQDIRSENYRSFFKRFRKNINRSGEGLDRVSEVNNGRKNKIAIIFGNEVGGIPKQILMLADHVVDIPMVGEKESLNVSVSAGIILYELVI